MRTHRSDGWGLVAALLAMALGCGNGEDLSDGGAADGPITPDAAMDAAGGADAVVDAMSVVVPVIVSPPPGSALKARRQAFEWTADGSDFRLRIGTSPGAADLFDSGPLGDATGVTVDGLPLSGATIYAELSSGPADARVSSTSAYQAPLRRGLAVVVDFADARLEDWVGPGLNDMSEVEAQLEEMEDHWEWLSRDLEQMRWEVIRVEVDVELSSTAFPSLSAFREAVVGLAREQIDVADHDVNGDGVIDSIWAIVSDQGTDPPFASGGSTQTAGAFVFVDGQATLSVVEQATGNFNHELGHALELPDVYGTYDTVGDLSLMANSWPVPPGDLSAYERVRLGWVDPLVIGETTHVEVPSAHDHLFALKIPTTRVAEYFLVEYRRRPDVGYGSATFDHDGLAVWHVLEGSNQHLDPPLLKLEPADGITRPSYLPEANDLGSPENPGLQRPWVLTSHVGGDVVFAIDDLTRTPGGALAFEVRIAPPGPGSQLDLIANPSVEIDTEGWRSAGWRPDQAVFSWAAIGAVGSARSLALDAPVENDVEWVTRTADPGVGGTYLFCGWLKGEAVALGRGATLSVSGTFLHTPGLYGTFDWTQRCMLLFPGGELDLACRLGGFGQTTTGKMWCDDVRMSPLGSAF